MQSQRNKPDWNSVIKALKGTPSYIVKRGSRGKVREFNHRVGRENITTRNPYKPVPELDALWARAYK